MDKIIAFKRVGNYSLCLIFNDGQTKTIDFAPLIGSGISTQLLDMEYFGQVKIDNGGGLEWPNGMDFCPNYLKDYVFEETLV